MSNAQGLTKENLLFAFPAGLRENQSIAALGDVTAEALAKRPAEIGRLRIYARIDELPEELLDILAYDFKVDWWDGDYTPEEKRRTLKDSFLVHRRLGTKYAVETAISAIYPGAAVQEWFEYGGEPYTFRLFLNVSGLQVDLQRHTRVLALANFYKNLRSHLDGIEYIVEAERPAMLRMGGQFASVVSIGIPELADEFRFEEAVRIGGQMASVTSVELPAVPDVFAFAGKVRAGGTMSAVSSMPIPAVQDAAE